MRLSIKRPLLASAAVAVTVLAACASSPAMKNDMSFFVTSRNGGNGAIWAGSKAPTGCASRWRARPAPAAAPGGPT